jgi:hypothetical protein
MIRLGSGRLDRGFNTVNIEFKQDGKTQTLDETSLGAAPELQDLLNRWEIFYRDLLNSSQTYPNRSVTFHSVTSGSTQTGEELKFNLEKLMNDWLNLGNFSKIERAIRTSLNTEDRVIITIVSDLQDIWKLPWHSWDLFKSYPHAVEVFSKSRSINITNIRRQKKDDVNILGLFGRSPELELKPEFLNTLPNAHVEILTTISTREVADFLITSRPWDIFIFSGHGNTIENSLSNRSEGIIYLDNQTELEISRLKGQVQQAVNRGLQIAIFNCCNGFGLAEQLSDVNIPYIIVMRERIPDRVAHQFLVDLLTQYSQGDSFPAAFRYARAQLALADHSFAKFADWLPVLFHNPLSQHVTWQDLVQPKLPSLKSTKIAKICNSWSQPKRRIWTSVVVSALVGMLILSLKSMSPLVELENAIVDRVQAIQAAMIEPNTSKVMIVNYDRTESIIIGGTTSNNAESLAQKIDEISQQAKPTLWIVDLNFEIGNSSLNRDNILKGCTDRNLTNLTLEYSRAELECDNQANAFHLLSSQPYFKQVAQQKFRLSPHLINKIESIDIDKIKDLPVERIKQLFDNKIVLVGSLQANQSIVTRDAQAIDRMIRAVDPQQPLALFVPWQIGLEFGWIFLSSMVMAFAAWHLRWRLWVPTIFVVHLVVAGVLLFFAQGVPLASGTIAMLVVGGLILSVKQMGKHPVRSLG